jgi:hypothetical protein
VLLIERIAVIRGHARRHSCCSQEVERHLDELQAEVDQLLALARANDRAPARIHVTVTTEGNTMTTFAPGAPITFTAGSDNAENQPVADTYTWTSTAGTIVPGPDSTTITISDAPLGDVTATATDPLGIAGSATATVADQTPTVVNVTVS